MNNKNIIRKNMRLLRRRNYSIDENAPWKAAKNFYFYLKDDIKTIGLYWPMLYELDTRPLIKLLIEKEIDIFLPSVFSNKLKFLHWKLNDKLVYNKLKFYEPKQKSIKKIPELILVPMLAFDIGYGYAFQEVNDLPSEHFDLQCNAIITNEAITNIQS